MPRVPKRHLQWEEEDFAAEMTRRQFVALRTRLDKELLVREFKGLRALRRVSKSAAYERQVVRGLLANGWNTERILRLTCSLLKGEQLLYALQWAFPQAYYSCYAVMIAFFRTVGHNDSNHSAALKRFGGLVAKGDYPNRLTFLAEGGRSIRFRGIQKHPMPSSMHLDLSDPKSVDTQICQFLKGTRERDLADRRKRMRFKTKTGREKKRLTSAEWESVSKGLGPTSVLSLLYRKRIKANYREIDAFLSHAIAPEEIYDSLVHIVSCVNFVHEAFILHAVGHREFQSLLDAVSLGTYDFLEKRARSLASSFSQGAGAV